MRYVHNVCDVYMYVGMYVVIHVCMSGVYVCLYVGMLCVYLCKLCVDVFIYGLIFCMCVGIVWVYVRMCVMFWLDGMRCMSVVLRMNVVL